MLFIENVSATLSIIAENDEEATLSISPSHSLFLLDAAMH